MSLCKEYKILFDYKAREPDEINLKKGKYVRVVSKNEDENYWKGEADGKMGLFPKDFVSKTASKRRKEIEDDTKEVYQVIYDYKAENDDELTIKQEEVDI